VSDLREEITPLFLTYNEVANIARTLGKLEWAQRIVIVDSGSTDGTIELARSFPRVEVVHRTFDSHAEQWNFGLSQISTPWVLSLDADYELSDGLLTELGALVPDDAVTGYRARFVYRVYGKSLRATLYPPRVVLHRVGLSRYVNRGHTQELQTVGLVGSLTGVIYHDDRKPLARWFDAQRKYAALEADYLIRAQPRTLSRTGRLRRMGWPAPLLVLGYVLFVKGCILDGRAGWFYALQRLLAEVAIGLEVLDKRLARNSVGTKDASRAADMGSQPGTPAASVPIRQNTTE
jgi:glycosyltransferase involved in cell wall biosynthesis